MDKHLFLIKIHIENAVVDRREKKFLSLRCLYTVDIVCSCLHHIRQRSERIPFVRDNSKSDEVGDKEFVLLKRHCLVSCDQKVLLAPSFHLVHSVNPVEFQDDHVFEEFYLTDL